ncbi:MAG: sugar ABC transporter ATP-binding protein [Anaerolineae bacterium]|nr:sugar ABC transporter ATP-binding protein [Anaerolineae bacterium]
MAEPMLKVVNAFKRFGGLVAVNNVSIEVYPGEVVALLGDNGAGKSTLIKMISGVYPFDGGEMFFDGKPVHISGPMHARDLGIETIYQDLALAENLDVGANVFLGREVLKKQLGGLVRTVDDEYMRKEAAGVLKRLEIEIPNLRSKIGTLSGGQRQAVAISRAVYWNVKLMIMDEPTAALGVPEQRKVLALVRQLRDQNIPVIIISHTMQDVLEVADRMIVMRRGRQVADVPRSEASVELLVRHIVGG